ncbi:MAG: hypothetical protein MI919_03850, partial [Holophagales bacterium]|nr:hypothetical protein [Holophagales bacterium]
GGYRDSAFSPEDYRGLGLDYGEGHFTCFQFPYDWRRDNVESARRLFRFLKQTRDQVAAERERRWGRTDPVRFDVIAHSMGGLVLRYMLRYGDAELPEEGPLPEPTWAGAELVERAILVATPNAGALDALEDLAFGRDFGPFLPRYPPAVLGTLPGGYQLLPRHRHRALVDSAGGSMDFLDPDTWIRKGWGLADPAEASVLEQLLPGIGDPEERRRVALDHLEKSLRRARRFHQALDRPSAPPATTELVLFAGDSEPTPTRARFEPGKRRLEIIEQGPGDGTVSRASALMDERSGLDHFVPTLRSPVRWSQVSFLFTDHLGITSDPTFSDNVLYLLLEAPPLADP